LDQVVPPPGGMYSFSYMFPISILFLFSNLCTVVRQLNK
jgi:hypothetical protein